MGKSVEEMKAELAALEEKQPDPVPVNAQPFTPAPAKHKLTENEQSQLAHMKNILAELSTEVTKPTPEPEAPAPAPEPAPVPEERRPVFSRDDLFRYRAWCVEREHRGESTSVADWIKDTGVLRPAVESSH